jgi:hypothetical protein
MEVENIHTVKLAVQAHCCRPLLALSQQAYRSDPLLALPGQLQQHVGGWGGV